MDVVTASEQMSTASTRTARLTDETDADARRPAGMWTFAIGLAAIGIGALATFITPLSLLFRTIPRNYNEGWNAFWAEAATQGSALYASAESLVSNNYPPVSFFIVGRIGHLLGDNIIAGRLVSLASLVALIAAGCLWLRASGTLRMVALAGGALMLAAFSFYAQSYIAMNDPQMLAHALMLSGLAVLWRFDFSRPALVTAAVLMLLGGFTKHLLIPLPVAVTVWLAIYRRQSLVTWLACFAVGLPVGFWLILKTYPQFFDELLGARVYSGHKALSATLHATKRFLPLLVVGAIPLVQVLRSGGATRIAPRMTFVLLYLALSLIVGTIAAGGEGVVRNAFFDLLIASSLFAALGLEWMWNEDRRPRIFQLSAAPALMALFGASMTVHAVTTLPQTVRSLRDMDSLERDTRTMVAMIGQLGKGRAACETLALCYWAHGQFTLDFFNYGQKLRTGSIPVEFCKAALARGEFPVLQLEAGRRPTDDRLGPCTPAIYQYYTEAFRSRAGTLLVPKRSVTRS
jgi:hypothetical protein